jgi:hypothetical protein
MMLDVPNSASKALVDFIEVDIVSEFKSCGGQGTILSDTIVAFLVWGKCHEDGTLGNQEVPSSRIPLLAAVAGCMVTRKANRFAFKKKRRSVVSQDIMDEVGDALEEVFDAGPEMSKLVLFAVSTVCDPMTNFICTSLGKTCGMYTVPYIHAGNLLSLPSTTA